VHQTSAIYTGIQFVDIPEFPEVGTVVGQYIAGTLAGKSDVAQALVDSQAAVQRAVKRGERPSANVSKVYVIAHSMGNQLVMNAVNEAGCGGEKLAIAQMVLAAPDVDWDLF
jgi:alpha-beta hydrolase superfamily lysophospholipase